MYGVRFKYKKASRPVRRKNLTGENNLSVTTIIILRKYFYQIRVLVLNNNVLLHFIKLIINS